MQAQLRDRRIALIQVRLADIVPEAERAALVFTRIDTATLRQATQDDRDFGVVVSDQDARQIERTNDPISRLDLIWRGLSNQLAVAAAPAPEAVADAMAALARTTGPLSIPIRPLFENLGRMVSVDGTFAVLMAGRWVAGLAAANSGAIARIGSARQTHGTRALHPWITRSRGRGPIRART